MAANDATATLTELEAEFVSLAVQLRQITARREVLAPLIEKRKAATLETVKKMDKAERDVVKKFLNEEG